MYVAEIYISNTRNERTLEIVQTWVERQVVIQNVCHQVAVALDLGAQINQRFLAVCRADGVDAVRIEDVDSGRSMQND